LKREELWLQAVLLKQGENDIKMRGGIIMVKTIQWETSLSAAQARAKKEKKLILMDFYNSL
jgi:hypothetical protein